MRKILASVLVAACSGGTHATPDARSDATPDALLPGPNDVTIDYLGDPLSLIAYRDGAGPWQVPEQPAAGSYVLHVTNDYQLVLVCKGGDIVDAALLAYTFGDGAQQFEYCFANDTFPPTFVVSGAMTQAGTVAMGTSEASATHGPWSYMLDVEPGTHDLFATDNTRMVLRRNIAINGATTEPAIDVSAAGSVALSSVPLALSGIAPGDTLYSATNLVTTNEVFLPVSSSSTPTVNVPPASVLVAGDKVDIFVDVTSSAGQLAVDRGVFTTYAGATSFTLPEPLAGVSFSGAGGAVRATWGTLPAFDDLELAISTNNAPYLSQYVSATSSWLSATGATSLSFDAMPPGFDPSWIVPGAGSYVSLETKRMVGDTYSWSTAGRRAMFTRGEPGSAPWVDAARLRAAARQRLTR